MQKDDNMSLSSNRAAKRPRIGINGGDDDPPLDLLSLYQSDVGDKILSYASGDDLCTLDILNKQFQSLTTDQWKAVTKDRFGMNNGKEGWRVGISFLRPPVLIQIREDEDEDASPKIATNGSKIATINCIVRGVEIRDAETLDYIQTTLSTNNNWNVTICGREGSEVIVTSRMNQANSSQLTAQRVNDVQQWEYSVHCGNGIPSIGCENHLIVALDGKIQIFEVNNEEGNNTSTELLTLRNSIAVCEGTEPRFPFGSDTTISWEHDKTHFIVGYPHQICVWKFDAVMHNAILIKTITVNEFKVETVALSNDYIVASTIEKKIHIWDRNTGDKMVWRNHTNTMFGTETNVAYLLYANGELELDEEEDEIVYPLSLSCHGHILVSSNHMGGAVCIWDMKTGKMLKKRHVNPEDVNKRQLDIETTGMVYLEHLNSFMCITKNGLYALSFPTSQRQSDNANSIRERQNTAEEGVRYMGVVESESDW